MPIQARPRVRPSVRIAGWTQWWGGCLIMSVLVGLSIISLPHFGCSGGKDKVFKESKIIMDTLVEIMVAGRSEAAAHAAMGAAFDEIRRIDGLLSSYRDDSLVARLNREGHQHNIKLEKDIFALLREATGVSEQSGGAFDITIWPVSRLWRFGDGPKVPDRKSLVAAVAHVGYRNLQLDDHATSVGFAGEGMGIDLGAIAKGWAVDRAVAV